MKKVLVNYADRSHRVSQTYNSSSAISVGGFDTVFSYNKTDIDDQFLLENSFILSQPRGAGYWAWKPYVIKKALSQIDEGDVLMYSDSGITFINSADEAIGLMTETEQQMLLFELEDIHPNKRWTKRDCFVIMGLDHEPYLSLNQILASYIVMRKNDFAISFIDEWLKYAKDYRVITDTANECGLSNYPEFVDHRHDQSILSLLGRKHKVTVTPDISQFGVGRMAIKQLFDHHRNRF